MLGRGHWKLGRGRGRVEMLRNGSSGGVDSAILGGMVREKEREVFICLNEALPGSPRSMEEDTGYPTSPKVWPRGGSCISGPE